MSKPSAKPRVGIFMPAYNQGPYIHEAIESLKRQTFQDFEVAIVDDASTDNVTIPILEDINYDKAVVYLHEENRGVGKVAREYYQKLKNEFIFILCADDVIEPTYIEKTVAYLDSHKDVAAVATWIQCFGANSDLIKLDEVKANLPYALIEGHFLGSALARRKALEQIDFGLALRRQNDYDRWVSMMENGWKMGVIPEPLFLYRQLPSSLSHTVQTDDELEFRRLFIERHEKLLKKHYTYVLEELYTRLFTLKNWTEELSQGKDWLEEQYVHLTEEQERLNDVIKNRDAEVHELNQRIRYGITIYPLVRTIKKLLKR